LPSGGAELATTLPPSVAAWIVAEQLRFEGAGADPEPAHAGAPVQRLGAERFAIRLARRAPGALRIETNGRLLPPAERDGRLDLSGCAFVAQSPSAAPAGAEDAIGCEIHRDGPATRIDLQLAGSFAAHRELIDDVAAALRIAERIDAAQEGLGAGGEPDCMLFTTTAEADSARHRWLRGWWHLTRAAWLVRDEALPAARAELRCAVALSPAWPLARQRLAQLERRLARDGEVGAWMQCLGDEPVAALHVADWLQRAGAEPPEQSRLTQAMQLLAAGDALAARKHAARAERDSAGGAASLRALATIDRAAGHPQLAYEALLAEYERAPAPALLLALHDAAVELRREPEALLLAALAPPTGAGDAWRRRLAATAAALAPDEAARLLVLAGAERAAAGELQRWIETGAEDTSLSLALRRLAPWTPAPARDPAAREPEPGFGEAPGVAPLR
jgi:hypothetical protein